MDPSYYPLAAAAGYGEARLDALANNLANINTPGYKADQMRFAEVLSATGTGIHGEQFIRLTPGTVETTGNSLDLAIHGDGFFSVSTPDGERYTRDGGFRLDPAGQIVTSAGFPLLGDAGPLIIDPGTREVEIDASGRVLADGVSAGTVRVVTFSPTAPPVKVGGNLLMGTQPLPVAAPQLAQGALEHSNVEAAVEMTRMIEITRGYETYQKLIQTLDQMAAQGNNLGTVV